MELKTLFQLCIPREETLKGIDADDVQELDQLLNNQIDPEDFFSKCFITNSMKMLFQKAFARFSGRSSSGLIVLKQAMGGGKTHNMIALGLVAKYPNLREKILGPDFPYMYKGKIDVVGFTGRSTTALPWIEIARQLNRLNVLSPSVRDGIEAPSDKEWCELLGGGPVLILLDEIPYYLEYAQTVPKGSSDKAHFVYAGLANLFNAINSPNLSQVMVVLADLEAKYEKGGEYINNAIALSLKDEAERTAEPIKPIDMSSPEIYEILRKKLFKEYPQDPKNDYDVNAIAVYYTNFLKELENAGLISDSFDNIKLMFKESYPFHPGIIHLIANFRNNLRFQQTRGLLRLFRRYVKYLYTNQDKFPNKYFITVSDYDLGESDIRDIIVSINPNLDNAISIDVHSLNGTAKAQYIDSKYHTNLGSKFAKAILFSSLSSTDQDTLGLTEEETYVYTLEPGDDLTKAKNIFEEYWRITSYSKENQQGKKYFGYNENVNALMLKYRENITIEEAEKMLIKSLIEYFTPRERNCYQTVYQNIVALPKDLTELQLKRDEITLVISKPVDQRGEINKVLYDWWESLESNKNRVLFLTGATKGYNELIEKIKDFMAWYDVLKSLKGQVNPNDPEYKRTQTEIDSSGVRILELIKNTFNKLYYPHYRPDKQKNILALLDVDYSTISSSATQAVQTAERLRAGITSDERVERLLGNNRDGEVVIRETLKKEGKYAEFDLNDIKSAEAFNEEVLFNLLNTERKSIIWDEVKKRAADEPRWLWHPPGLLDKYKEWKKQRGDWEEENGEVILKPTKKASVEVANTGIEYDFENDEIILKLKVKNADIVYYQEGSQIDINTARIVDDFNAFRVKPGRNVTFTFAAVDSTGKSESSDPFVFKCPIALKLVNEYTDAQGFKHIKLKSLPQADIYYTTDGSSPINSDTTVRLDKDEIVVNPTAVQIIRAVAVQEGIFSKEFQIPIDTKVKIKPDKPVLYKPYSNNYIKFTDKKLYEMELRELSSFNGKVKKINLNIESTKDSSRNMTVIITDKNGLNAAELTEITNKFCKDILNDSEANINGRFEEIKFERGSDFIEWLKLYNKTPENCIGEFEQNEQSTD